MDINNILAGINITLVFVTAILMVFLAVIIVLKYHWPETLETLKHKSNIEKVTKCNYTG